MEFILIPVPNLPQFARTLCRKVVALIHSHKFDLNEESVPVLIRHPRHILPDFGLLDEEQRVYRNEYYISLIVVIFTAYCAIGFLSTCLNNCLEPSNPGYTPLELQSNSPEQLKELIRSRWFMTKIVVIYMALLTVLLQVSFIFKAVSTTEGAAWEFWVAWFHLCLSSGLMELLVRTTLQSEVLPLMLYPKQMFLSHLPLLSEKVDTAKNLILVFAICEDEPVLAVVCWLLLFASQFYLSQTSNTHGELVESYLPILTSSTNKKPYFHDVEAPSSDN